jgi:hypothetical protein
LPENNNENAAIKRDFLRADEILQLVTDNFEDIYPNSIGRILRLLKFDDNLNDYLSLLRSKIEQGSYIDILIGYDNAASKHFYDHIKVKYPKLFGLLQCQLDGNRLKRICENTNLPRFVKILNYYFEETDQERLGILLDTLSARDFDELIANTIKQNRSIGTIWAAEYIDNLEPGNIAFESQSEKINYLSILDRLEKLDETFLEKIVNQLDTKQLLNEKNAIIPLRLLLNQLAVYDTGKKNKLRPNAVDYPHLMMLVGLMAELRIGGEKIKALFPARFQPDLSKPFLSRVVEESTFLPGYFFLKGIEFFLQGPVYPHYWRQLAPGLEKYHPRKAKALQSLIDDYKNRPA